MISLFTCFYERWTLERSVSTVLQPTILVCVNQFKLNRFCFWKSSIEFVIFICRGNFTASLDPRGTASVLPILRHNA